MVAASASRNRTAHTALYDSQSCRSDPSVLELVGHTAGCMSPAAGIWSMVVIRHALIAGRVKDSKKGSSGYVYVLVQEGDPNVVPRGDRAVCATTIAGDIVIVQHQNTTGRQQETLGHR